jgi:hypothetical protein
MSFLPETPNIGLLARSSDLFWQHAFPKLISGIVCYFIKLTAAGTVLDLHQIPFSNGAKIGQLLQLQKRAW